MTMREASRLSILLLVFLLVTILLLGSGSGALALDTAGTSTTIW
jgi:hypothetical protein